MTGTDADIQRVLGRIEGKLDGIVQRLDRGDKDTEALHERVSKVDHRVASVESKMNYYLGFAGAIGAFLTTFGKYLYDRLFA